MQNSSTRWEATEQLQFDPLAARNPTGVHLKVLGSRNPAIHNIMQPKKIPVFSAANAIPLYSVSRVEVPFSSNKMLRWLQHLLPGSKQRTAILYTRRECHLCEVAAQTLAQAGYAVELVDIDQQSELRQKYDHEVPVVEIDGRIRFRGRVDPLLLKRLS